jgi:sugar/nucleoside kinase (ribokinase family)
VPRQFSWIDQRFIRDRHITRCRPVSIAFYLLLVTVADERGLSYYSEAKSAELLSVSPGELRAARRELLEAGLIAFQEPFYQVLSLDRETSATIIASNNPQPERTMQTLSFSEALRQMLDQKPNP